MESLLSRAFNKLAVDAGKKQRAIRESCEQALAALEAAKFARPVGARPDDDANKYFGVLKAACESGQPKLVVTALDTISKLIAFGYFKDVELDDDEDDEDDLADDASDQRGGESGSVGDGVVEGAAVAPGEALNAVGSRADPAGGDSEASGEEGEVAAAAAAAAAVPAAAVGPSQRSGSIAGSTATAAAAPTMAGIGRQSPRTFMDVVIDCVCRSCDMENDQSQLQVIKVLLTAVSSSTVEVHEQSLQLAVRTIYQVHLNTHNPVNAMTAKASLQQMLSVVFARMEAADQAMREKAAAAARATAEDSAGEAKAAEPQPPLPVLPEPEPELPTCPPSMYMEVWVSLGFEAVYVTAVAAAARKRRRARRRKLDQERRAGAAQHLFATVQLKDAFLLFRALCKLSMKAEPAEEGGTAHSHGAVEARQLESKILSLELLLTILEHCGPALATTDKFIYAVTQYLCESVLKNCTSTNTQVVGLSLRIFVLLSQHFKDYLKSEIEVFITNIFLRILESENSTYEHKKLVLDVVCTICNSPETLVEVFLNYDCDFEAIDLYQRIVNALSKVAKGRGLSGPDVTPVQLREENGLRRKGLEGLVGILVSLLKSINEEVRGGRPAPAAAPPQHQPLQSSAHGSIDENDVDVAVIAALSNGNGSAGLDPEDAIAAVTVDTSEWRGGSSGSKDKSSPREERHAAAVQEYGRKKKLMGELEAGFVRFNLAPHKGILYLESKGLLESKPRAVARFLHDYADKLDKTQIGEYLGKEKDYKGGFCVAVLHEYVDAMDFGSMAFDAAIRHFLSGFRLPGEAQKIDRMMEKFAERYCLQNPQIFPSADTAFILAFSVIMLNTDLHNPAVKEERKMTREGFIGNNRGIANGQNLPEEFLTSLFDRIKANPLSLKDDDFLRERLQANTNAAAGSNSLLPYFNTGGADRQKRQAFDKERQDMIRASKALFRQRKQKQQALLQQMQQKQGRGAATNRSGTAADGLTIAAASPQGAAAEYPDDSAAGGEGGGTGAFSSGVTPRRSSKAANFLLHADVIGEFGDAGEYVRAMFEVAWWPMLGAFSQVLEEFDYAYEPISSTDPEAEARALEGEMIALCLAGCRYGIRLSSLTAARGGDEGVMARETFINGLAKFTLLDAVTPMRPKNIECIRTLLDIALEDGNYLAESWGSVLRYVSQLARLQLFASGLHTDDMFFGGADDDSGAAAAAAAAAAVVAANSAARRSMMTADRGKKAAAALAGQFFGRGVNQSQLARGVEKGNAEAVTLFVDAAAIDRVFSNSVHLSSDAIRHFLVSLCSVSKQEINHSGAATFRSKGVLGDMNQPRVFSLQKLVEVADFNMDSRSRIVWANIWEVLSAHFADIGSHDNPQVAMYAIDSLRQLAFKFMVKEELRDFNFQRLFLKPFEVVMASSKNVQIREFILRCVDNLVQARQNNIRSGWKSVLSVLSIAARDSDASIAELAWSITDRLVARGAGPTVRYDFLDVAKCLLAFVEGPHTQLSLRAVRHLEELANTLALGGEGGATVLPPPLLGHMGSATAGPAAAHAHDGKADDAAAAAAAVASATTTAPDGRRVYLQLWWPLLFGLSENVGDPRPEVRARCLAALTAVLREHGSLFGTQTWELLFRGVLAPIMEGAATDVAPQFVSTLPTDEPQPGAAGVRAAQLSWIATTAAPVLDSCADLFFFHGATLRPLLPEVLGLFQTCICQEAESLARVGLAALQRFLQRLELSEQGRADCSAITRSTGGAPSALSGGGASSGGGSAAGEFTVWDCVTASLSAIVHDNLPKELLGASDGDFDDGMGRGREVVSEIWHGGDSSSALRGTSGGNQGPNLPALMTMLVVSLRLIPLVSGVVERHHNTWLSEANLSELVNALAASAEWARRFNGSLPLRRALGLEGFMLPGGRPGPLCPLLRQERIAYLTTLRLLMILACGFDLDSGERVPTGPGAALAGAENGHGTWQFAQERLGSVCKSIVTGYVAREEALKAASSGGGGGGGSGSDAAAIAAEIESMTPVVTRALEGVQHLSDEQVAKNAHWVYHALVSLIRCDSEPVRMQVQVIFATRMIKLLPGTASPSLASVRGRQ